MTDEAVEAVERSYAIATALISGEQAVYGLSTGFGALAERYIAPEQRAALQTGLVRSHAATVGDEVEPDVVRAMMLLRAATLAKGYSGIRPTWSTASSACSTPGSRRSSASTVRSGAAATWLRWPTWPWP